MKLLSLLLFTSLIGCVHVLEDEARFSKFAQEFKECIGEERSATIRITLDTYGQVTVSPREESHSLDILDEVLLRCSLNKDFLSVGITSGWDLSVFYDDTQMRWTENPLDFIDDPLYQGLKEDQKIEGWSDQCVPCDPIVKEWKVLKRPCDM
jgi:hypothetical protein